MAIKIPKETEQKLLASIKRFAREHMDEEIGDLKASLILDFCLAEIGPTIYNKGVADAQKYMQERLADLDGSVFEADVDYWDSP